jgi:hypothetical protein
MTEGNDMKTGTLKELNVKPGDVVEYIDTGAMQTIAYTKNGLYYTKDQDPNMPFPRLSSRDCWRVISRAPETPKRWRDMTPEEKGALLLAHHEGKVIEYLHECSGGWRDRTGVSKEWHDKTSYRIRPEPVRETVTIEFDEDGNIDTKGVCDLRNVRITVDLIDRNPVPASVKLDEI